MTEDVLSSHAIHRPRPATPPLFWSLAWRNLWRNRRRSQITIGGIAFAMVLLVFVPSMQYGMFGTMIENATRLLAGHVQVQKRGYLEDARMERTVTGFAALRERLAALPHVLAVGGRAYGFVLASANDRSVGAQVMGVMPDIETKVSSISEHIVAGRYIERGDEVVAGAHLVHNLSLELGDEVILLGTAVEGGVAALALHLVGVFDTGQPELDRTLLQIDLETFSEAFDLHDEAHAAVLRLDDFHRAETTANAVAAWLPADLDALSWNRLMPEVEDTIDIKHTTADFLFVVLLLLVVFSVVNTFVMTVYERTRELGMLLAIGMRRSKIVWMLHAEALLLALVGVAIGVVIGAVIVAALSRVGISLGNDMGEILQQYHMPDRLRPVFDPAAAVWASLAMMLATQVAAGVATSRVRRLTPVEALRNPE